MMGALFENFTLYFTTIPLESYYMDLKKIARSCMMHTEMKSKEELASCLKDFKERFVISYNKFLIKRSHKADLLEKVSHYYVTTRQLKAIQQFTSGLFSYSLLSSLRKFKAQAEKEFIYSPYPITSKYLQDLYTFEFTVSRDENLKHKEQKHCIQLV